MEINWAYYILLNFAYLQLISGLTITAMPVVLFYGYIRLGNSFNFSDSSTILLYIGTMQSATVALPHVLNVLVQASVSCGRILKFLSSADVEAYVIHEAPAGSSPDEVISMRGASLGWGHPDDAIEAAAKEKANTAAAAPSSSTAGGSKSAGGDGSSSSSSAADKKEYEMVKVDDAEVAPHADRSIYTLKDINFSVTKGQVVAIVGGVGSGKSSLLAALLGELQPQAGEVKMLGSIAYHSQQAWIIS